MALFLTYDNRTLQDGLGAQALRITGIYAVAKAFGLKYLHSPITNVIEDVGQTPEGELTQEELISRFNNFFDFPSDRDPKRGAQTLEVRTLSLRLLIKIISKQIFSRNDLVLSVLLPQGIADRFPLLYKISAKQLRRANQSLLSSHHSYQFVVHVRRGYDEKYADLKYAKNRHLPFTYYSDILEALFTKKVIPSGARGLIHTDLLNAPMTWVPKQAGIVDGFNKNSGQVGKNEIHLEGYDLSKEILSPGNTKIDIRYCDPLLNTFLDMCTTKVLVQGKSAFSYLAGIVNPNFVIYPPKQSMAKFSKWRSAEEFGVQLRDSLQG